MNQHQSSRRRFLKMSALLPISGLLLSPAFAKLPQTMPASDDIQQTDFQHPIRADIRSVDFDSHNFRWNFR